MRRWLITVGEPFGMARPCKDVIRVFLSRDEMGALDWLNDRTSTESNNNGTAFQMAWAALHLAAAIQHARAFQQDSKYIGPVHLAAVVMHGLSFVYHLRRITSDKRDIPPTQRVPS